MSFDQRINHKGYHIKKPEVVEEKVVETPVVEKVATASKEKKFEATDVNKDGKTDLKDAMDVVRRITKRKKRKKV